MKNILYLTILVLSFQFQTIAQKNDTIAEHYVTTSFKSAIFPESYNPLNAEKTFTPTKLEVDQAEKALSRDLMSLNRDRLHQTREFIIHKKLMRYNRQYFGFFNEKDEKIVLINAYFSSRTNDPHEDIFLKEIITGKNGGSKYWSVKYNLATNVLKDLEISDLKKEVEKASETKDEKVEIEKESVEKNSNQMEDTDESTKSKDDEKHLDSQKEVVKDSSIILKVEKTIDPEDSKVKE